MSGDIAGGTFSACSKKYVVGFTNFFIQLIKYEPAIKIKSIINLPRPIKAKKVPTGSKILPFIRFGNL